MDPADPLRNTRRSLVERLGNLDDQASWQTFFDRYGAMLYRVARAAGLTDAEAQEAVQETTITVARNISGFRYDPAAGSFGGWLLQTARWRIADQFRRRERHGRIEAPDDDRARTALIDRFADPAGVDLEAVWDAEWRENVLTSARAQRGWRANWGSTSRRCTSANTGSAPRCARPSPIWKRAMPRRRRLRPVWLPSCRLSRYHQAS